MKNNFKNKKILSLEMIVKELKDILKIYKNFENTNIAIIFDNKFDEACKNFNLSRAELYKKIINNKMI